MPPRCTFVVRSLLIISWRDCREADSRDTSPRDACLGEVSRKIWLHDFAINNNGGSVPVIFISLGSGTSGSRPYYNIQDGSHTFYVRGQDARRNMGSPASQEFYLG